MSGLNIFIAYSHKDNALKDALLEHLVVLRRAGKASAWHDQNIDPGSEWEPEISRRLEGSDIILLLISASFMSSEYCYNKELKAALERHERGQCCVIPVILRPCDWLALPLSKLQALPKCGKAVTLWPNQDEALTDVAKGIHSKIDQILARRSHPTESNSQPAVVRTAAGDVCPGCGTVNPQRCASCKRCFVCNGDSPSWFSKVIFGEGYNCGACTSDVSGFVS